MYAAADFSDSALGGPILIHKGYFFDHYGRVLLPRGLNVSGANKLPSNANGLSHLIQGLYDNHRSVTFIGRPFPLEEADLHFRRLKTWGLPLVRFLVTWEAIGHAGPDPNTDLDYDYISYVKKLVHMMPKYGIKCFICAHQDVWSRFSGGSGAPGWTFEVAGLDIEAFTETGAAYIHAQDELRRSSGFANPKEPTGPFLWPSGYQKLGASTMATVFWAGDALTPKLRCLRRCFVDDGREEEVSAQKFLQDALIEAFGRLADEIGDLEACIGFEPMNEPHRGLVNLHDFYKWNYATDLHIGHCPSFSQALALGSGYAQDVDFYVKSWPIPTKVSHRSRIDPKGRSAWLSSSCKELVTNRPCGLGDCVWRAHGVWLWDERERVAKILDPDYFNYDHRPGREGRRLEWYRDCYAPFVQKFLERVSRKWSHHMSLVEPIPNEFMPPWPPRKNQGEFQVKEQTYATQTRITIDHPQNLVYAPHFYDLNVLFRKEHGWMSVNVQDLARGKFVLGALYFGKRGLRHNYRKQIGNLIHYGKTSMGINVPIIIGEVGIPWDINDRRSFRTGNYDCQRELMDALISAMESFHVGFTLWNYNPQNTIEHGDGWNKEDFSVINSNDILEYEGTHLDYRNAKHERNDLYRGGRALDIIIRPYAAKVAGLPVHSKWDPRTLRFEFHWTTENIDNPNGRVDKNRMAYQTEIFLPNYHYAVHRLNVQLSDGSWDYSVKKQTLYVQNEPRSCVSSYHQIIITIEDERKHVLERIQQRREAFPPNFPLSLLPDWTETWLQEFAISYCIVILVVIVSLLATIFQY
ncbi:uncharacterized protein PV09_08953 [Verruconis gallopava]|uniref:Glycoside hydrolase family 5 C-terminal domain-containing protein n=1 Tax=Verruconis gallopava TaxID=253628 RepID=A0A0D1XB20_9PEZI|nr:uncharacterized protein PV09_08953 [Verruconis gallopava]KIV99415.1 hypothetical protein PV09_08953 [Verruconis gallopava]